MKKETSENLQCSVIVIVDLKTLRSLRLLILEVLVVVFPKLSVVLGMDSFEAGDFKENREVHGLKLSIESLLHILKKFCLLDCSLLIVFVAFKQTRCGAG